MPNPVSEARLYSQISATATVKAGRGELLGIFVSNAADTPIITIYDNTVAASPLMVSQFVPSSGVFYPLPFFFNTGLHIVISGTVSCTVAYA